MNFRDKICSSFVKYKGLVLFSTYHETDRLPANLSVSLCLKYIYIYICIYRFALYIVRYIYIIRESLLIPLGYNLQYALSLSLTNINVSKHTLFDVQGSSPSETSG